MLSINNNQMMIEHFQKVRYISNEQITIQLNDKLLTIYGATLHVVALSKHEVLVEGSFEKLVFDHDKK